MLTVGIKTLKNKLSEYLRAVAAKETVVVTDRGRVVAEIVPPRVAADASLAERRMAELVRQGLVTPARVPPEARLLRRRPVMSFEELLHDLGESRSDR